MKAQKIKMSSNYHGKNYDRPGRITLEKRKPNKIIKKDQERENKQKELVALQKKEREVYLDMFRLSRLDYKTENGIENCKVYIRPPTLYYNIIDNVVSCRKVFKDIKIVWLNDTMDKFKITIETNINNLSIDIISTIDEKITYISKFYRNNITGKLEKRKHKIVLKKSFNQYDVFDLFKLFKGEYRETKVVVKPIHKHFNELFS